MPFDRGGWRVLLPHPSSASRIAGSGDGDGCPQPVLLTTELPGRTSPCLVAEIRPQVNGLIQKRLFTEGAERPGWPGTLSIDPAPFQAALDNAQANLPALRLRVDRYKEALVDKAVSQQDFDDADAALKQAEAELEMARINLNYAHIVSPISGRIGTSTVTDGAIVTAYQPRRWPPSSKLDPIYVDVPQSTSEMLRLQRLFNEGRLNRNGTNVNQVQDSILGCTCSTYPLSRSQSIGALHLVHVCPVTIEPSFVKKAL